MSGIRKWAGEKVKKWDVRNVRIVRDVGLEIMNYGVPRQPRLEITNYASRKVLDNHLISRDF
jgi:hypothetical protein